jgi:hypothetical protein
MFSGCAVKKLDNGAYQNGSDNNYFVLFGGTGSDTCREAK